MKNRINVYNDLISRAEISAFAYKTTSLTEQETIVELKTEETDADCTKAEKCQSNEIIEIKKTSKKGTARKTKGDVQEV